MKIIRSLLSIAFFTVVIGTVSAQQQVASAVHTQHRIESSVLAETRTILVRVPADYERRPDLKYPVLYMLDAHAPQNAMMVGLVEQQVWGGVMPDMIIVGIQNTDRSRDLTPTDDHKGGAAGGGPKFLEYIRTEVMPFVEKNYRTHPYRIFAGHSLGGLFVTYTLAEHPEMFDAYIAASPVLGYDDDFPIKLAARRFKEIKELKKTLFVGLGDEPQLQKGYDTFKSLLDRTKPSGLEYEFRQYKDENHGSVVLPAYYAGIRKVFAGWVPPPRGTVAELEDHYRKLTERFHYEIAPPEAMMNRLGYSLLQEKRTADALDVFKKNARNYPYSANCYDSLADAYEKNGDLKQARDNYEKAYKMAREHGETQIAASAKANYERLTAKTNSH